MEDKSFWNMVDIKNPDQCWEWRGKVKGNGYGAVPKFRAKGLLPTAHRASWLIKNGPIPEGLWVLHKCDNRKCVNPSHLFLGTRQDNMDDMVSKGRSFRPIGTLHPLCKLTESQVKKIREDPRKQVKIAQEYGVSSRLIRRIKNREIWKHI